MIVLSEHESFIQDMKLQTPLQSKFQRYSTPPTSIVPHAWYSFSRSPILTGARHPFLPPFTSIRHEKSSFASDDSLFAHRHDYFLPIFSTGAHGRRCFTL